MSAVIVTRGDVDLALLIDNLRVTTGIEDIVVWNNATRPFDAKVYGRYLALPECQHDLVYVQDDDCLPHEPQSLTLDTANLPRDRHGDRYAMVGWGAVFHRDAPARAFARYLREYPLDDLFLRTCDVIFATLHPFEPLDLGYDNLPWATARNRMYRHPDHYLERDIANSRARQIMGSTARSGTSGHSRQRTR